jgi:hypothetical protein
VLVRIHRRAQGLRQQEHWIYDLSSSTSKFATSSSLVTRATSSSRHRDLLLDLYRADLSHLLVDVVEPRVLHRHTLPRYLRTMVVFVFTQYILNPLSPVVMVEVCLVCDAVLVLMFVVS